ncbi:MAG: hypothetical protein AAF399_02285 [Bacteroidota bacterium]
MNQSFVIVCLLLWLAGGMAIRPTPLSAQDAKKYVPPFILNQKAKKLLKQERYRDAAFHLVHSLNLLSDNNLPAAKQLKLAMQPMSETETQQISDLWQSVQTFQGDQSVTECQQLIRKCDSLQLFTEEFASLPPEAIANYASYLSGGNFQLAETTRTQAEPYLEELRQLAADMHYQRGLEMMANPASLDSNRTAVAEFEAVKQFVADYQEVERHLAAARQAATRRIAMVSFMPPPNAPQLSGAGRIIAQQVEQQLNQADLPLLEVVPMQEFIQIARAEGLQPDSPPSDWLAVGKKLGVHQIYLGSLDQMVLGNLTTTTDTRSVKGTYKKKVPKTKEGTKGTETVMVEKSFEGEIQVRLTTKGIHDQMWSTFSVVDVQQETVRPAKPIQRMVSHEQTTAQLLDRDLGANPWKQDLFEERRSSFESGSLPLQNDRPTYVAGAHAHQISLPIIKGEQGLTYPVITRLQE